MLLLTAEEAPKAEPSASTTRCKALMEGERLTALPSRVSAERSAIRLSAAMRRGKGKARSGYSPHAVGTKDRAHRGYFAVTRRTKAARTEAPAEGRIKEI